MFIPGDNLIEKMGRSCRTLRAERACRGQGAGIVVWHDRLLPRPNLQPPHSRPVRNNTQLHNGFRRSISAGKLSLAPSAFTTSWLTFAKKAARPLLAAIGVSGVVLFPTTSVFAENLPKEEAAEILEPVTVCLHLACTYQPSYFRHI